MSTKRFPLLHSPRAVVLAVACFLVTVHTALAQRAEIYEGKVDGVRIAVRNFADDDENLMLKPGDTLKLEPGQRVQLRPFSPKDENPTGERQYLSAEFTLDGKGSDYVEVVESDRPYGKVVIQARRRGAGKAAAIRYRLLGKLELSKARLAEDVIRIEIAEVEEVAPPAPPAVAPPVPPRRGVTLYEASYYRGDSETFYEDRPDLRYSRIGNDRASSIKVPEGCTVTLYRDTGYQGRIAILRTDLPELDKTEVGNDAVSSLKIVCQQGSN